jgi:hypothetical protein
MAQLRERVQKCLVYLATFRAEDFAAVTAKMEITLKNPPGKAMCADDALRAGGVDVGKMDFLGDVPPMFDQSA